MQDAGLLQADVLEGGLVTNLQNKNSTPTVEKTHLCTVDTVRVPAPGHQGDGVTGQDPNVTVRRGEGHETQTLEINVELYPNINAVIICNQVS